jgi:O-antigen ligase
MVKSRSAFLSIIIFFLIAFSEFKKNIKEPDRVLYVSIFVSIIIFILSSSWVVSKDISIDEEITDDIKYAVTSRYNTINDNPYEEKVLDLSLFYFRDGRAFSSDGNLNWRLQIWQDILSDMWNSNNILNGYGFQEIIPAMNSDQRLGQDGTNINVHNYVIHILSRGGMIHLTLYIMIYYQIFKMFKAKAISKDYQLIVFPLIFNSLFDPSMENAHYSIIMYLLIGLALNNRIILKEENLNL